ncbi:acetyl-CoA hydrolase [Halopseudomonas laoshanensis]|uniref:Acetyl-CoA hydrolase n=1 Tax=Halopseudomonas laoshanensis TaxID=2268758 RepID=A0A7V7KSZ8_9GAMM|nr:acetyl-CoA hydrolase/transferase C-terminal domain-containing protein [Halopseudomonas laoshanensis]KAA0690480.1 acetyl-CoA hydrolase [Halopseudomonas laoshanensis]
MSTSPTLFTDCEPLIDILLDRLDKRVVVGLPLGLGKANHLINSLYRRAREDASISLTIFTALTLEKPRAGSEIQARFLGPLAQRLFDDYPPLEYAQAVRSGELPENIRVVDFFLQPGQWLGVPLAQQAYTSLNYTHALDTLIRQGVNLILQLVSPLETEAGGATPSPTQRYSLSCNPDISADLLDRRRSGAMPIISVGQVNTALPFMHGDADRPASDFDYILHGEAVQFPLFSPPNKPAGLNDYAIGLQVARLIPDAGSLQIGIGSIGDAITHSLLLRHQHNALFQQLAAALDGPREAPRELHLAPFDQGLYGVTEMLVEGFLKLIDSGIMKREVDGAVVHAGFFIGSPLFHQRLAEMPAALRDKIAMMPVSFTNQLYGDEAQKRQARSGARFVNSAIMVTLGGAVVSDGLANNQIISGVGGQYNFIAQAFALEDARSVITLEATRTRKGKTLSNICWEYPHTTIPRHLRDIVITEYGMADLRDKSDAEVIAAMLNICDSAFQPALLAQAKKAGKIAADYQIPLPYRCNTPERIAKSLQPAFNAGELPSFPLGSGMTAAEDHLAVGLSVLAPLAGNTLGMLRMVAKGIGYRLSAADIASLERMQLAKPTGIKEQLYRALLIGALASSARSQSAPDAPDG